MDKNVDKSNLYLPENHPVVDRLKINFAGKGGEHVVFTTESDPDHVLKVQAQTLLNLLKHIEMGGEPPTKEQIKEKLSSQNARFNQLKNAFDDHVPNQETTFTKVPVNKELLEKLQDDYSNKPDDTLSNVQIDTAQTFVTRQEIVPQLTSEFTTFSVRYAEDHINPENRDTYEKLTSATLLRGEESFSENDLLKIIPGFKNILEEMHKNPSFKKVLAEFVQQATNYSNDAGDILDVLGENNIIFFEEDNKWDFKLVDSLYTTPPPEGGRFKDARKTMLQFKDDGYAHNPDQLKNTINYVRAINALAMVLEIEDRINLFEDSDNVKVNDILDFINYQNSDRINRTRRDIN